jgi:hypothetical protein
LDSVLASDRLADRIGPAQWLQASVCGDCLTEAERERLAEVGLQLDAENALPF